MKGLFITGSDTNVGKTYIACQIATELKSRDINVIPRKPVETGCELINGILHPDDANLLLKASGSNISLDEVCPNRFSPAISPQIAAELSGDTLSIKQLSSACLYNITDKDFILVEGAGGFYSPICNGALNSDLAKQLDLPIILVTEDRLGAVNQTLLAINAIEKSDLNICAIILNKSKNSELYSLIDNAAELRRFTQYSIYKTNFNQKLSEQFYLQLLNDL